MLGSLDGRKGGASLRSLADSLSPFLRIARFSHQPHPTNGIRRTYKRNNKKTHRDHRSRASQPYISVCYASPDVPPLLLAIGSARSCLRSISDYSVLPCLRDAKVGSAWESARRASWILEPICYSQYCDSDRCLYKPVMSERPPSMRRRLPSPPFLSVKSVFY